MWSTVSRLPKILTELIQTIEVRRGAQALCGKLNREEIR